MIEVRIREQELWHETLRQQSFTKPFNVARACAIRKLLGAGGVKLKPTFNTEFDSEEIVPPWTVEVRPSPSGLRQDWIVRQWEAGEPGAPR